MNQYVLTSEMIRQERERRKRVKAAERVRVKGMLRLLPGGKLAKSESVGECEQTSPK